jgi:hypothetical protein
MVPAIHAFVLADASFWQARMKRRNPPQAPPWFRRVECPPDMTAGSIAPPGEKTMSRFSRCAAVAVFTAVMASSGAYAAVKHLDAARLAGARNGPSEQDTRKQCLEEARTIWPSTSWDMQANRDAAAESCLFDHGLEYP